LKDVLQLDQTAVGRQRSTR